MNTAESVSRYGSHAASRATTCSTRSRSSSWSTVSRSIFAQTTDLKFVATAVTSWLSELGVITLFIEPASPWENGLHRVVQRQAERRAPQRRGLLHTEGGADPHRTMAPRIQPHKT